MRFVCESRLTAYTCITHVGYVIYIAYSGLIYKSVARIDGFMTVYGYGGVID
jgi:hypothetical protein